MLPKPKHAAELFDAAGFSRKIAALRAGRGDLSACRAALLAVCKEALGQFRETLRQRFMQKPDGLVYAQHHAWCLDHLLAAMFKFLTHLHPLEATTRMALIATGGYGRGELCPYSDLDILFLCDDPDWRHDSATVEAFAQDFLTLLWDMGLKVGHAVRPLEDAVMLARKDFTIRTAALESRLIAGNIFLEQQFQEKFQHRAVMWGESEFLEAKLEERERRLERYGDSRYMLEPQLKEGKGGLRDLHTLLWLARHCYGAGSAAGLGKQDVFTARDVAGFEAAHRFLLTLRTALHLLAGRMEDRLSFDWQPQIATLLGYKDDARNRGVEKMMRRYFLYAREIGHLTRRMSAALEQKYGRRSHFGLMPLPSLPWLFPGFFVRGDRLDVADSDELKRQPLKMISLFKLAQEHHLDMHPHAMTLMARNLSLVGPTLRRDKQANQMFLDILTGHKPDRTLRLMNEAGVLGKFIPDFAHAVGRMQFNMYHVHTVDEHTLIAVGILSRIENQELTKELPVASRAIKQINLRHALYVALLLHDITKGKPGDHSILGAKLAEKLGPRLGLSKLETETASWLIRWHLLMSHTAFQRDLGDPKTIQDFVEKVQSVERLRLLLILTVADIRAVSPNTWNDWKAVLLRELYARAEEALTGALSTAEREDITRGRLAHITGQLREQLGDWKKAEIETFIASSTPSYWLAFDQETHGVLARLRREEAKTGFACDIEAAPARAASRVLIAAPSSASLFARMAAALTKQGVSITGASAHRLKDGMEVGSFWVQDALGGPVTDPEKRQRLEQGLRDAAKDSGLPDTARFMAPLPARVKAFAVAPSVMIDNQASEFHTLIEVRGRDRKGFLATVVTALARAGLTLSSAHVSTYGERAVDVFYVNENKGEKIPNAEIEMIKNKIITCI
ncbi:MAG: [protein-PII] uridylyltransferase [Alphaproteobacteria bacterium]|nr:[protein-PII] uridylyltransferase [Alphaproteobacteria bacterium]